MKTLVVSMVVALFTLGCQAQDQSGKGIENLAGKKDTKNKPEEHWTVNKEVDENGNVIAYDSTYTWSYTNSEGDSVQVDADSLMQSFKSFFNEKMPSVWGEGLMNPMFSDSLLCRDFFSDNYFHDRFGKDFFDVDKMFQQMDSLRESFFKQALPQLEEKLQPIEK
ncbi:hypothetical protein INQ51_21155 [Maribellus sp. CM-23]|uniref:hypothetical protein n=1 Tax=Maribellus sp. CM-23 TaxID=2781026 RepID=UPI001F305B52|nr:hypothetical protein [Maribellus sp. CM-23]MCE4566844.1 hypothetical protein [Maribellus sp. CM-23]